MAFRDRQEAGAALAALLTGYADRPDVIDAVLADNYRVGADLDWRLQRAAETADAAEYRQALLDLRVARSDKH